MIDARCRIEEYTREKILCIALSGQSPRREQMLHDMCKQIEDNAITDINPHFRNSFILS